MVNARARASRGMRHAAIISLVAFAACVMVLTVSVRPAAACSCAGSTDSARFARADVVFEGVLTEVRSPPADEVRSTAETTRFVFTVGTVYKGAAYATQSVVAAASRDCGLGLYVGGGPAFVFALLRPSTVTLERGELYSNYCLGTRHTAMGALPAEAGLGGPPLEGASAIGGRSATAAPSAATANDSSTTNTWALVGVVAAGGIAVSAAALVLRRRRHRLPHR